MTDKLELKSSHEVVDTVDVADVESIFYCKPTDPDILTVLMKDGKRLYCDEVCPVQEEPINENLEEAARNAATWHSITKGNVFIANDYYKFIAGAKWQKERLWKDAQSDDLPDIDREVIALIEAFGHYKVIFAHRVDENAEIHTSIDGKPLVLHPKRHGKGGWNIPDLKFWLDCELPKMEE